MKSLNVLGLAALAWAAASGSTFAAGAGTHHESFLPDNNLYLEDNLEQFNKSHKLRSHSHPSDNGGITEDQFNKVIDRAERIFKPLAKGFGGTYGVTRKWTDATVNASAERDGDTWNVNMYGGLARRKTMTEDGFALVLCHETGHQFGGFPFANDWAADEGQADYFATTHCGRLVFKDEAEVNASFASKVEATPKAKCDAVWSSDSDRNICYRVMVGSKALGDTLASLSGDKVSFDDHDSNEVDTTDDSHPASQCRLDTYVAGATCTVEWDSTVIPGFHDGTGANDKAAETESAKNYCAEGQRGVTVGFRPHCWFKPGL